MASSSPAYGEINLETASRWLHLPAEEDGHVWMLNLMKYHAVAQYEGGNEAGVSGEEADDRYAPLGPLAGTGNDSVLSSPRETPEGNAETVLSFTVTLRPGRARCTPLMTMRSCRGARFCLNATLR